VIEVEGLPPSLEQSLFSPPLPADADAEVFQSLFRLYERLFDSRFLRFAPLDKLFLPQCASSVAVGAGVGALFRRRVEVVRVSKLSRLFE